MHLRSEMVLGVITVVEEEPVIDFAVAAHAPCNRFVRVRAVVAVITVQITEAMTEIPKRQKIKNHIAPVEEEHHEQRRSERCQFEISPEHITIAAFTQFLADGPYIVAEKAEENIPPRTFRFAVVPMPIDRQPVNRVAI